jgi:hypothetical protein
MYPGERTFAALKAYAEKRVQQCDVVTGANCAPNQKEYIEKYKAKTLDDASAAVLEKSSELKKIKAEREAAEIEIRTKQAEWKKKEKNLAKAMELLKKIEKAKQEGMDDTMNMEKEL